jgi:hypothetical protein
MNAYDMDLNLRIAPELYLQRCVVGGIDKVLEINRNFRNEGADSARSPEFAMIEGLRGVRIRRDGGGADPGTGKGSRPFPPRGRRRHPRRR